MALCGGIFLEEALDLSFDRLLMMMMYVCSCTYVYLYIYICGYKRIYVGRGSLVGIATGRGLDGPGMEYLWGREFPRPSRPSLRPTQSLIQWITGYFQG